MRRLKVIASQVILGLILEVSVILFLGTDGRSIDDNTLTPTPIAWFTINLLFLFAVSLGIIAAGKIFKQKGSVFFACIGPWIGYIIFSALTVNVHGLSSYPIIEIIFICFSLLFPVMGGIAGYNLSELIPIRFKKA